MKIEEMRGRVTDPSRQNAPLYSGLDNFITYQITLSFLVVAAMVLSFGSVGAGDGQTLAIKNSGCSLTKSIDEFVNSARDEQEKGLYFLAIADYSCAIGIDPQRTDVYRFRAGVLATVGQFEAATADIKKVMAAQPHNYVPHALLAVVYFEQGKYDEALAEIDTTLELNSLDAYSYLVRGQIYVELNNENKALEALNQYFQLQKLSFYEARGYAEIGFAYAHFGDEAVAQTFLEQAAALHGDIGTLYISIAQAYRTRANYPMALENLNRAIRLGTPEMAAAYTERAAVYMGLQADSKALNDCDSIIQLQPQKPEGFLCKGAVLIDLRKTDQALNNFNHALELDSTFMAAYSGRAIAEIYKQNYDLALSDLNVAIKANALVSNNYRLRAQVYTALNNPSAAIADYETYLRLQGGAAINPDVAESIRHLKEILANL